MNKYVRHNWVLDVYYNIPLQRRYFCENCEASFTFFENNTVSIKTKMRNAIKSHNISQDCRVQKVKKIMDE